VDVGDEFAVLDSGLAERAFLAVNLAAERMGRARATWMAWRRRR